MKHVNSHKTPLRLTAEVQRRAFGLYLLRHKPYGYDKMADPITSAATSAVTSKIVDRVIDSILRGEGEEFEWKKGVYDLAIEIESTFDYHVAPSEHKIDLQGLKTEIDGQGRTAQKLAVIGRRQNFEEDIVNALEKLSESCAECARHRDIQTDPITELESDLDDILPKIHEYLDISNL